MQEFFIHQYCKKWIFCGLWHMFLDVSTLPLKKNHNEEFKI